MPTRLRPAVRVPRGSVAEPLVQRLHDSLYGAVMSRRLAPGTRLGEVALGEIHGVSRTVVRQALYRLTEARIVQIVRNRGAHVARPIPVETREVFVARRVIEAAIEHLVATRVGERDLARRRERLRAEHGALHAQDQARWAQLTNGFHLVLAALAGKARVAAGANLPESELWTLDWYAQGIVGNQP